MPANRAGVYMVSPDQVGWLVAFNCEPSGETFARFSTALSAARDAALARWEVFGLETRVMVKDIDDRVFQDSHYGPGTPTDSLAG